MIIKNESEMLEELRKVRIKLNIPQNVLSKGIGMNEFIINKYEGRARRGEESNMTIGKFFKLQEYFRERGVELEVHLNIK